MLESRSLMGFSQTGPTYSLWASVEKKDQDYCVGICQWTTALMVV